MKNHVRQENEGLLAGELAAQLSMKHADMDWKLTEKDHSLYRDKTECAVHDFGRSDSDHYPVLKVVYTDMMTRELQAKRNVLIENEY